MQQNRVLGTRHRSVSLCLCSLILLSARIITVEAHSSIWALQTNLLRDSGSNVVKNETDSLRLEPGRSIDRELNGGEIHWYHISLVRGQYARLSILQKGIDVLVFIFGPDGEKNSEVDSPNGYYGSEPVAIIADKSGDYRIEVRSTEKNAPAGRYEIKAELVREATESDKTQVIASRKTSEAQILQAKGTAESLKQAIDRYEEALAIWRSINDRPGQADALENIGVIHYLLGSPQQALQPLEQALSVRQTIDDPLGKARLLVNLGLVFKMLGESPRAIDYYEKALHLGQELSNREIEALALVNLGSIQFDLGDSDKALDYFFRSLTIVRSSNKIWEANALSGIARVYASLGQRQRALDSFNRLLVLFRELGHSRGVASTLNNIGELYYDFGENQKALESFYEALFLSSENGDTSSQARILNRIGELYGDQSKFETALNYYQKAAELFAKMKDPAGESVTLRGLGKLYTLLKQYQKALDYYYRALSIQRNIHNRRDEAQTLSDIGFVYASLSDYQNASEYHNQALSLSGVINDKSDEARSLLGIAEAEYQLGYVDKSKAHIEDALNIIDSLRANIISQQLRSSYFATVQKYYDFYIDLLIGISQQHSSKDFAALALEASERARARSLFDLLTRSSIHIREGVDPSLLEREKTLWQTLTIKRDTETRLLERGRNEEEVKLLEKEIDSLTTEYESVGVQIRARSPRYAALIQPRPLTAREIQNLLDDETVLLEYALGDKRSFLWAVTPQSIEVYVLPGRAEIETIAKEAYELLRRRDKGYWKASSRLSEILIGPVKSSLGKKRLLIVPQGILQFVPFAALPVPKSKHRFLVNEHEIVYSASASILVPMRRDLENRKTASKSIAVFADPVFTSDDERVAYSEKKVVTPLTHKESLRGTLSTDRLPRLLNSRYEAAEILSLLPKGEGLQALDFDANLARATSADLGEYRILHFATHGIIDNDHPELSSIVLSLVDKRGKPQDGLLRLNQIFNMKLSADLVVLSGCSTGLGKDVKGEGLVGLTRGFMYAGVPRVLVSLWGVDDRATAELMIRFYRNMLREGMAPASALRLAQTQMAKDRRWLHPFYWAGFTLQGEWR